MGSSKCRSIPPVNAQRASTRVTGGLCPTTAQTKGMRIIRVFLLRLRWNDYEYQEENSVPDVGFPFA